ncbi:hypothetical protein ONZ45_g5420 [Pleurotus djamor]|nr:hypothetical protein ONZ45_g5420 [Pleurotus djamor]
MRFTAIVAAAFFLTSSVIANGSDKVVIDADFSPSFENALLQEFGSVAVEGFKSKGCKASSCGLVIGKKLKCIVKCLANDEGADCIDKCISLKNFVPASVASPKMSRISSTRSESAKIRGGLNYAEVNLKTATEDEVKEAETSFDIKKDTLTL